jgi:transcriptional regulator with PAS, ATPase and Fis domain
MKAGRFREDLYYRINVINIDLPPLRESREDVAELVRHFLLKTAREMGSPRSSIDDDVDAGCSWPTTGAGNVRELENEVNRVVAFSDEVVLPDVLSESVRGGRGAYPAAMTTEHAGSLSDLVARVETSEIQRALRTAGGNKTKASQILGISRFTLQRKLEKYEIDIEEAT